MSAFRIPKSLLAAILWIAFCSLTASAADAAFLGAIKGEEFLQNADAGATPTRISHQFIAFVDLTGEGTVLSASVTPPGKASVPLEDFGDAFELFEEFPSRAELDAAFPNGSYLLSLTGQSDGPRSIALNLAGDAYPPIPRVNNYTQLQLVPAGEPLTLSWQPFTGGTASDFIQVYIEFDGQDGQTVFETAAPGEPGSLDGTSTSVQIPAGTLQPGRIYTASVFFGRILGFSFDYGPETPSVTGYYRETRFSLRTAGQDLNPPHLAEYSPGDWNGAVPRQSGVAFIFNEPMQARQAVTWTGLGGATITYRWTTDGRILYCLPSPALPPDADIGWQIDRSGFSDLAGNRLIEGAAGGFHTAAEDPTGVGDLGLIGLYRAEFFEQAPGGPPTRPSTEGYAAAVFADSTGFNTLLEGTVETPDGSLLPLPYTWGDSLELEDRFDSPEALAAAAPSGTYTITVHTAHDGTRVATVGVPDPEYPTTPEIVGLQALEGFDPAKPLELRWNPFVGGGAGDVIRLQIYEQTGIGDDPDFEAFGTPEFPNPGYLDGTHTSVVIPAGTLARWRRHRIELEFIRLAVDDTQSLPGARVVVAAVRVTNALFTTGGEWDQGRRLRIDLTDTGRIRVVAGPDWSSPCDLWVLERAANPAGPWDAVHTFEGAYTHEESPSDSPSFFRVRWVGSWPCF